MDVNRSKAALASLMENASARGKEFEAAAARRLDQFRGLLANGDLPNVDDRPVANAQQIRIDREPKPHQSGRLRPVCKLRMTGPQVVARPDDTR
jgi:hypothetical protein